MVLLRSAGVTIWQTRRLCILGFEVYFRARSLFFYSVPCAERATPHVEARQGLIQCVTAVSEYRFLAADKRLCCSGARPSRRRWVMPAHSTRHTSCPSSTGLQLTAHDWPQVKPHIVHPRFPLKHALFKMWKPSPKLLSLFYLFCDP